MKAKLVYSTNTTGEGELARSNKRFKKKVKSKKFYTKGEIAEQKLNKLFDIR